MKELLAAGWRIMNIKITFEGVTFALWHPAGFAFLVFLVFRIIGVRRGDGD